MDNPVIQWAAAEIARLRKNADGHIQSRVAEDIAVESAWERCGITPHWPDDEAGSIVSHAESMAMEIARLREERRWVPVGEKIPEKYERVILFDPTIPNFPRANTHVVIGHFRGHDDWVSPWFSPDGSGPTHWMPLPPGPEGK
jgi:hypothetical protein